MEKRERLSEDEVAKALERLEGWRIEGGRWLEKRYLFGSFPEAIAFVNRVAEAAERDNHHPFVSIDYRKVTLRLTTWHSGGLTALDFESAQAYDLLKP